VKYFSEDRVARPADAQANLQFYVWWAFLQRLAQTTLNGAGALFLLPHWRDYALFSLFALLFAFKGLPSIAPLGRFVAMGLQRFDVQGVLDLVESKILRYLAPIPFVLLGRAWGAAHPEYGEIYGAAIGLAFGYLAMTLTTLVIGLIALRVIGVPIRPLFLAQFDWRLVKRQFLFGGKIALGAEPIFLVNAVQAVVITIYFTNFTAWQGIQDLLMVKMLMLFQFAGPFYNGAVSAISEAYSAGKKKLTQYYIARFFQFGFLFHATIYSLMLALGTVWIEALGEQYARAVPFLGLSLVFGLLWPAVFISDNTLKGAGRPLTLLALMYTEYGVRIGLIVVLVPRFGFTGLIAAGLLATALKAVLSWTVNHRTLVRFHLSPRAALLAPAVAGAANYLLWKGILVAWAPGSVAGVLALLCVAAGLSFLVTFLVAGLAGGFDEAVLEELRDAAAMISPVLRPVARAVSAAAHAGARLSPITPRPLPMTAEADAEAEDLTEKEHEATGETLRPHLG
jgi:O-antigen/teichoic acid export membrane protein